ADADAPEHVQDSGRDAGGMLVLGAHPAHPAHSGQPAASSPPEAAAGALERTDDAPQIDVTLPLPTGGICPACGGTYDGDGYCEHCGVKAPDPRQHFEIAAGPWVGGVCDRGVRHSANEDAVALHAELSPGGGMRAAMVVCDGVSTAPRSAQASLAAARAAVGVLSASRARGLGVREALIGALGQRLEAAADAANEAVEAVGTLPPGPDEAPPHDEYEAGGPSCTFVAAAVEDGLVVVGNVGDSRAYWFPDEGQPLLMTIDDSWAAEAIRAGADRAEAESGPHAHTITRWLGPDAPDHTPVTTVLEVTEPGWLLLCSDGLWNYASEPERLAEVFAQAASEVVDVEPVRTARWLVEWAIAQGGNDNITAALARLLPAPPASGVDSFVVPSQEPEATGEASMHQPTGDQPPRGQPPGPREQG
ncbi:MAG: PP2C family serine/threonine-protein phosphatase, partial [Dermatophilaceae bacterium]